MVVTMRLRTSLVPLASVLIIVTPAMPVSATGGSGAVDYYGVGSPITIWCPADPGRTYLPHGTPDEHTETEPTEDPAEYGFELIGWTLSGWPECAPGDALARDGRDTGISGGAFCYAGIMGDRDCGDHKGHTMTVTATDELGTPYIVLDASADCHEFDCDAYHASGCGTVTVALPHGSHWQAVDDTPRLAWALMQEAVYQVPGTLEVCSGSYGVLEAVW